MRRQVDRDVLVHLNPRVGDELGDLVLIPATDIRDGLVMRQASGDGDGRGGGDAPPRIAGDALCRHVVG